MPWHTGSPLSLGAFENAAKFDFGAAEETSTSEAQVLDPGVAPRVPSRNSDIAARTAQKSWFSAGEQGVAADGGATCRLPAWDAADFAASGGGGFAANTTSGVSAWDAAEFAASEPSRGEEEDCIPAAPSQAGHANAADLAAIEPFRGDDDDYIAAAASSRAGDIPHANDSLKSGLLPQATSAAPALNSRVSGFDGDDFVVSPTGAVTAAVPANHYWKFDELDDMPIEPEDTLPNLR